MTFRTNSERQNFHPKDSIVFPDSGIANNLVAKAC